MQAGGGGEKAIGTIGDNLLVRIVSKLIGTVLLV